MTRALIAAAGAITLGVAASVAHAAPIGAATAATSTALDDGAVTLVHGLHRSCRWDEWGYHRSRPWGRQACVRRPAFPLALWMWRCADGHCGYWHRHEHRWRDGGKRYRKHY